MKKMLLSAAIVATSFLPQAKADTILGLYLGADYWMTSTSGELGTSTDLQSFQFEDQDFANYYVALEHPVPLIPNVKIKYNELELNANTALEQSFSFGDRTYKVNSTVTGDGDLSHIDYVLYYEIFDNSLVSIDLGLSAKQFDGYVAVKGDDQSLGMAEERVELNGYVPLAYGAVELGLPLTGLSAFAEGSFLAFGGSRIQDYQLGIAWEFIDNMAVDVALKAGYRSMMLELDDIDDIYTDIKVDGVFAGLQVHF
jgi:outer membrane protein